MLPETCGTTPNIEFLNLMFANVIDLEIKWLVGTGVSNIGSPDWTFTVTVQSKSTVHTNPANDYRY